MRTTITLDDDLAARLKQLARERDLPFKQVLNEALRAGLLEQRTPEPFVVEARDMGLRPGINIVKALQLAAELEDEEIIRKMQLGK